MALVIALEGARRSLKFAQTSRLPIFPPYPVLPEQSLVMLVHSSEQWTNGRGFVEKLDAYLTIRDAAEFLGVSPNTLRNWGRDGKVPMHRNPINGYRLFKTEDLKKLLHEIEQSRISSRQTRIRKPR